jgi:hypothetical protein
MQRNAFHAVCCLQVLMKVVEGTTVDDAVNIMNEAHLNGLALVAQCAQVRLMSVSLSMAICFAGRAPRLLAGGVCCAGGAARGSRQGGPCAHPVAVLVCCCPCLAALAGWLQDQAEQYCESLRLNGLIVTIEPAGDGGSGGGGSGGEGGGPNTST